MLTITLSIVLVFCNTVLSPVVLGLAVVIHVYEEGTEDVNGRLIEFPLQMETVEALVIDGAGFIVTTVVAVTFGHPLVPVTVFVTV